MKLKLAGLIFGTAFGFVLAWSRLSDPLVIHRMLMLREIDVFLLMGSAVAVASAGTHLLRWRGARAVVTGDRIAWSLDRPSAEQVFGSAVFGAGWSLAGTCPGPVAAMIGQGRLGGIVIAAGLVTGVLAQAVLHRLLFRRPIVTPAADAAGL